MRVRILASPCGSTRPTHHAAFILGLLSITVVILLIFEGSFLDLSQDPQRRSSPLRAGANSRLLHGELAAAVMSTSMETSKDLEFEARMYESDPVGEVPTDDRLRLSLLQVAYLENREAILPWTYGKPGLDQLSKAADQKELVSRDDPELLEKLRQCPDVDIFLPAGIYNHGYCEDATPRLLPMWAIETPLFDAQLNRTVTYHELYPRTPFVLFNYYWHDIPFAPDFPKGKQVYFMPSIEMCELNVKHYWNVDVVLCKTRDCYNRLTQWYKQEGNPRSTKVFYTKHTSSDLANFAKMHLGLDAIAPKDFASPRFIHTVGGNTHKGTRHVLNCWLPWPDFPPLDLFIHEGNYKGYETEYGERIRASQINVTTETVDAVTFGKAIVEASFFLCTSTAEGYGHYINQARASSGVIISTNSSLMNELISSRGMGVYVNATRNSDPNSFLGGAYKGAHGLKRGEGMTARITKEGVCEAVKQVILGMTASRRQAMAARAKQQYHADPKFFARRMLQLHRFAVLGPNHRVPELIAALSSAAQDPVAAVSRLRREEEGGSSS